MDFFKNEDLALRDDEELRDGVIYCKHCNKARLFISDDGKMRTRCLCDCQKETRRQGEEARELEKQKHEIKVLRQNSLLGKRYENSCFEKLNLDRPTNFIKAVKICKRYCEKWKELSKEGQGLYIYGTVGTGKTELIACICNELTSRLIPVLVTNFYEIIRRMKSVGYEHEVEVLNELANIQLLILDDFGTENLLRVDGRESYFQDKIYDVINWRYINKKPTLYTSNYSIDELMKKRGLKRSVADRISAMSVSILNIDGDSYRMNGKLCG